MARLFKRTAATRDLVAHYVFLAEDADLDTANRFLDSFHETCHNLLLQPLMGVELELREPRLIGLRKWRVKNFQKFLVFYLPHSKGISIIRVLHSAQDWWSLFGIA